MHVSGHGLSLSIDNHLLFLDALFLLKREYVAIGNELPDALGQDV